MLDYDTMNGWYSPSHEKDSGYILWTSPEGALKKVTLVQKAKQLDGYDVQSTYSKDAVHVGKVYKPVSYHTK